MTSTNEVIARHLKSFSEGDLAALLADYSPRVVFFTPQGLLQGIDAIKPLFQAMIAEFSKPGAVFSMKQQFFAGDYGYILWTAETADNIYKLGTDTFVVHDGKIQVQSFTAEVISKA